MERYDLDVYKRQKEEGAEVFVICAQIEQELAELDEDEKKEYLDDLGVTSSGLDKLVAASYSLLGLCLLYTSACDKCIGKTYYRVYGEEKKP